MATGTHGRVGLQQRLVVLLRVRGAVLGALTAVIRGSLRRFRLVGLALLRFPVLVFLVAGVEFHVRHRTLVEPIAGAPMQFVTGCVPAEKVGAHVREASQGQGRVGQAERHVAEVAVQKPGQIELVGVLDQGMAAVRGDADVGGAHLAFGGVNAGASGAQQQAAVGAVVADRHQAAALRRTEGVCRGVEIDAAILRPEVRRTVAAGGHDRGRCAAVGGQPNQVRASRRTEVEFPLHSLVARGAQGDDALTVGGEDRIGVEPWPLRQALRLAPAVAPHPPDVAACIAPAHEGDPFAVRRERWMEGFQAFGRQRFCAAAAEFVQMNPIEGGKGSLIAVRRQDRRSNQARLHRAKAQPPRKLQARPQFLGHIGGERDVFNLPRLDRHPANAPVGSEEQGLAIRCEGVAGQQVPGVAGLLVVALHGIGQPTVLAGLQVAQAQARVLLEAGAVGQQAAVRREPRAHGAALRLDNGVLGPLAQVPASDPPLGEHLVVGKAARLGCVVNIAAIGRIHRAQRIVAQVSGRLLAFGRGLGDLHPLAAVDVVGPEFVGAQPETGF